METLKNLVENATNILVVSHSSPDYDAYSSLLFTYAFIKESFPTKTVHTSLDTKEPNQQMSYLPYFNEINYGLLSENLKRFQVDLLLMVDFSEISRAGKNVDEIKANLKGVKTVLFDHHEIVETDFDLFVSNKRFATVEVFYTYLVENNLPLPKDWEKYYLTGFVGDSYRFYYQVPSYRKSFDTVATILDHGYTIREYSDKLYGYTPKDLTIFKLLLKNLSFEPTYVFTYITWDEYHTEIEPIATEAEYKKARRFFIDEMMVKTYGYDFAAFIVPDDTFNDNKTYSGSIRARDNTVDCTTIASYLGGGGHTTGSGFVVTNRDIDQAISQVKRTINEHEAEARRKVSPTN